MNPLRAILLKVISVTVFIVMSALVKAALEEVPAGEAVFFRSLLSMPVIAVWLSFTGDFPSGLRTRQPMAHLWRGAFGTVSMALNFAALGLLSLPEATAIGYAAPLLVVIFAAVFLHEEVRAFRLGTVALGLVGVLIVLSPGLGGFGAGQDLRRSLGITVALGAALLAALAQIQVRNMVQTERTGAIVFYFALTSTVLSLMTLPFGWVVPTAGTAAMLVATGLLGGIGQVLLTSAYRYGDASLVAPFEYSSMLWSVLIGYFVFSEVPVATTLIGGGVVIVAGVAIIWREHRLGLDRRRQREARPPEG